MTVSDIVKVLEEALAALQKADSMPKYLYGMERLKNECEPDRIRVLIDALIDEESRHFRSIAFSNMETTRADVAEARLSKAIKLLKEASDKLSDFGHEKTASKIDMFMEDVINDRG